LLELVNAKDLNELKAREAHYIRTSQCVNKLIPNRTIEQYTEDNKEKIAERRRDYYEDNKETILEKQRQYNENNKERKSEMNKQVIECSCGKTYTHGNKSRHNKSAFHLNNKKEQI
jgi:hypothetical protein